MLKGRWAGTRQHAQRYFASIRSGALVQGYNTRTTQTKVVLQGHLNAGYLAIAGLPPQVPDQFRALRQTGGSQRMAFGQQSPRRVDDHPPAIGVVTIENEAFCLPFSARRCVSESSTRGRHGWCF